MPEPLDEFDATLRDRIGAAESRVRVSSTPPTDPTGASSVPRWFRPAVMMATAATAIVLAVFVIGGLPDRLIGDATPSPSAEAVPTELASVSPSPSTPSHVPTASPIPTPPPPTTDLAWSRTGDFPSANGHAMVTDMVAFQGELIAVGVSFDRPLPIFGPTPPHVAQLWRSTDGRSWEAMDLGPDFVNIQPRRLIVRPDGTLLMFASRGIPAADGTVSEFEAASWESADGRVWTGIEAVLPQVPSQVVQGNEGFLAYISSLAFEGEEELWYSADGRSWELVDRYPDGHLSIGAGDEGFVVAVTLEGDPHQHRIHASANGREWVESGDVPSLSFPDVIPLGPDWVLVNDDTREGFRGKTWHSANGLEWSALGQIPLKIAEAPDMGGTCNEYIRDQFAAGPWLIVPTELSYPCSESGHLVHGSQYLSVDGASWVPLPLPAGVPGQSRSGSTLHAAVAVDDSLVVAGEQDGAATFWIGEAN
jgi:hypothetical protein